jgi:hypothetical protein
MLPMDFCDMYGLGDRYQRVNALGELPKPKGLGFLGCASNEAHISTGVNSGSSYRISIQNVCGCVFVSIVKCATASTQPLSVGEH